MTPKALIDNLAYQGKTTLMLTDTRTSNIGTWLAKDFAIASWWRDRSRKLWDVFRVAHDIVCLRAQSSHDGKSWELVLGQSPYEGNDLKMDYGESCYHRNKPSLGEVERLTFACSSSRPRLIVVCDFDKVVCTEEIKITEKNGAADVADRLTRWAHASEAGVVVCMPRSVRHHVAFSSAFYRIWELNSNDYLRVTATVKSGEGMRICSVPLWFDYNPGGGMTGLQPLSHEELIDLIEGEPTDES